MPARPKKFLLNDPVYGIIEILDPLLLDLLNHPWFQRLRRIRQLGMTQMVYPGAIHTRFQHAIGAMHLTRLAVASLRSKGHKISPEEETGVCAAVLLHDMGHGPFSHSLEGKFARCHHEVLSLEFMKRLNGEYGGKLSLALEIFSNRYPKKFLSRLVSGQLDMDRLDYLKRDSFYCGVSEGMTGTDRIIKMLEVCNDELAIEAKGIYSVESFILSRRLMYWQVYLHKTVISAEYLGIKIMERARELTHRGDSLFGTEAMHHFLVHDISEKEMIGDPKNLNFFARLDDTDFMACVKEWAVSQDSVLSTLSLWLIHRKLYKTTILAEKPGEPVTEKLKNKFKKYFKHPEDAKYFVFSGILTNKVYNPNKDKINILYPDGKILDIAKASDHLNLGASSNEVKKYFLACPKDLKP